MGFLKFVVVVGWCALIMGLNFPVLMSLVGDSSAVSNSSLWLQVDLLTGAGLAFAAFCSLAYVRCLWGVVFIALIKAGVVLLLTLVLSEEVPGALGVGVVGVLIWGAVAVISYVIMRWNYTTSGAHSVEEFD